jgi:3-methyladenine DNA glycosylase/8-oxoguanine DNA glycosylase
MAMRGSGSTLTVAVPGGFDLARAVCSYGYFLLAPNRWEPRARALHRPLRGEGDRLIGVVVDQPGGGGELRVRCEVRVGRAEAEALRRQVRRMLRLGEDFSAWRRLHPQARRAGFDRLFRSPTLFEDIVKTITGCNVSWPNTMRMNALLCERVGSGGFPTPGQLASVRPDALQRRCKVGYRAQRIVHLARRVAAGELDLGWFEDPHRTTEEVEGRLLEIHGIGPYAAANICQLLGRYDRLAIDSETYRHFRQQHGLVQGEAGRSADLRIEAHFARFAPYQFLAYWFELWQGYQGRFGEAHQWEATTDGPKFTANRLRGAGGDAGGASLRSAPATLPPRTGPAPLTKRAR